MIPKIPMIDEVTPMKNFFKPILNKKGLTLAEILVVLFISSVILVIAANLMKPVQDLLNSVRSNAHIETLCDTANEFIRGSVQTANDVTVFRLDDTDPSGNIKDESLNEVDAKLTAYQQTGYNVKAIAVLKNSEGWYRVYDFGKISVTSMKALLQSPSDDYALFNEAFYENTSFKLTMGTNDPTSKSNWVNLSSRCYYATNTNVVKEGDYANRDRALSFKLLQGTVRDEAAAKDAEGNYTKDADGKYVQKPGESFVILYQVKDWTL